MSQRTERRYGMNYEFFSAAKEKAADLVDDAREGLSIMDRFLVTSSVRTRTIITDTKNGKKVVDTEDGYTREFSLLKAAIVGVLAVIAAVIIVASLCNSAKNGKKLREHKKELKRIKRLCKKSGVEYEEDLPF